MIKWIGQHIWDFVSRFRNDVYLESLTTTTESNVLVVDSNGKVSKSTSVGGDITSVTAGTNCSGGGASGDVTINVDDAFLINSGDDATSGVITAAGFTTTGTWTFDEYTSGTIGITTVQDSGTTFNNNDTSLMTAAAIDDHILSYSYSTASDNAATATLASTVTVTDSTANTDFPIVFHDEATAASLLDDTGTLIYNPSTGLLTTNNLTVSNNTTFGGSIDGDGNDGQNFQSFESDTFEGRIMQVFGAGAGSENFTSPLQDARQAKVFIQNSNADAFGGTLTFYKASTGADNDECGVIHFFGKDEGNGLHTFGQIISTISDATPGEEAGKLEFKVAEYDGTVTTGLTIDGDTNADGEVDVTIGAGAASTTTIAGNLAVGTISSGTWEGTDIGVAHGGTGLSTVGTDRILTGNGTGPLTAESALTFDGSVLTIDGNIVADGGGDILDFGTVGTPLITDLKGMSLELESSQSNGPDITLKNSHTNATCPRIAFQKTDAGTDDDDLGKIQFIGADEGGGGHTYANILAEIADATPNQEAGRLTFNVYENQGGGLQQGLLIDGDTNQAGEVDVTIGKGVNSTTTVAGDLYVTTTLNLGGHEVDDIQVAGDTFADVDDQLMSAAAIDDRIQSYSGVSGTDLGFVANGTSLTVTSSNGLNASLPVVDTNNWGVMSDELFDKLDGIEALADVTDATNVTNAGALMDTEVTNLAFVKGLTAGIADGNVLTANDAVADDDFLRINGTEVEGRTASEVLGDIGAQAALTFGIGNGNAMKFASDAGAADDDFLRIKGTDIEGLSAAEVKTALSLSNVENTALSTYTGNGGALDNQYITNGAGYVTSNTMGSGFTVSATTDSNATTITQGEDLFFAAGTGITCETTADGTVTITNTVSDTNTQNTTTLSFVDSTDDIILRNTTGGAGSGDQDIKFVAGSNITLEHTDANNITIAASGGGSVSVTDNNNDTAFPVVFCDGDTLHDDSGVLTYNPSAQLLQLSSSTSSKPKFQIVNSHEDGNAGNIDLHKSTTSPLDGDDIGSVLFTGVSDDGDGTTTAQTYGEILVESTDVTTASVNSSMKFKVKAQNPATGLTLAGSNTLDEVDVTVGNGTSSLTTIAGDLKVIGGIKDDDGTTCVTFDSSGNTGISGNLIANKRKFALPSDGAGNVDGDVIYIGTGTTVAGKIYYYASDGSWQLTNSDDPGTATGLLAVAIDTTPGTHGMLVRGMVDLGINIDGTESLGSILYLDKATPGAATTTAPTATGDIVRVIGYAVSTSNTNKIWFSPDNTWVEHV